MFNNTCYFRPHSIKNLSYLSSNPRNKIFGASYDVTLSASIIIAFLSPVALVGNALVLAAIWKNPSLRTPSYIMLAGLAATDLGTGLITQPVYVVNKLILLNVIKTKPTLQAMTKAMAHSCVAFFSCTTILIITLMSIERWLHMSRRCFVTVRRTYIIIAIFTVLPIPLAVYHVIDVIKQTNLGRTLVTIFLLFLLFCLTVTTFAYFKIFRIIQRHQQQVSATSNNFGQPSIDFAKYKRSVFSICYILVVVYIAYLPMSISLLLFLFSKSGEIKRQFSNISFALMFLSSSLNPLLYLWRMRDIRNEVSQLLKRISCNGN